jgi:hypothetical protein
MYTHKVQMRTQHKHASLHSHYVIQRVYKYIHTEKLTHLRTDLAFEEFSCLGGGGGRRR